MQTGLAGVIVAGGRGARLGGESPKQFQPLLGKPVLTWSVEAFARAGVETVVVAPAGLEDQAQALAPQARIVTGGDERMDSVRRGLAALETSAPRRVLIHDAARPGVTPEIIEALANALDDADGAAPYAPMSDSMRQMDHDGRLLGCPPRDGLVRVQTPQAFRFGAIMTAYAAWPAGRVATDDLEIAHAAGLRIRLIPGQARLHKLTFTDDFSILAALMGHTQPMETRTGFGVDAHRFGPGAFVTLCGVEVAHTQGLLGHSDADAGWHALTDAILGALSLGDIGDHFPPTDPQWKGAPSRVFLQHAAALVAKAGGRIVHADVTLICERPRIKPHREAMRAATAAVLGVAIERVSVKATTTEEMGFTGRSEGIAAQAVATVQLPTA